MTLAELEALVAGGESDKVEFKTTTGQRTDGAKAVCAMLNGDGGFVLFGVRNDGAITGQEVSTRTLEELWQELRRLEPHPLLSPDRISLGNGHEVIVISIPGGTGGPFTYDGRPYIRQGPSTVTMPQDEYGRRLVERAHPFQRWEIQSAEVDIGDLDHSEIVRTIAESLRRGRMDDPGTRDPEELLRGLGLLREGRPLNAAVVLFARADRLLPYYPQCLLRLARFRGTDRTEFVDNRQEVGNAFELLKRAQRFLRDHLPVAGRVVPDLFERADDPLYPPEALREALANAICHRDYSFPGSSVGIAIYDDRLEITSTGRLPFGLAPEDLKRPHASQPWNPLIASVFYRRGVVEQWGRGTLKILELTSRAGLAEPAFEQGGGEVVVRFLPTGYVPPSRVSRDLTPLHQEILNVVASKRVARLSDVLAALPDVPRRTVQDNLQILKDLELVDSRGRGRGAMWMLKGNS